MKHRHRLKKQCDLTDKRKDDSGPAIYSDYIMHPTGGLHTKGSVYRFSPLHHNTAHDLRRMSYALRKQREEERGGGGRERERPGFTGVNFDQPLFFLCHLKMRSGQSLWIQTLLLTSLQLWETLWASTSPLNLPAPKLLIRSWSRDSVVLVCRASGGHRGVLFRLFRFRQEVDSMELSPTEEVLFTVQRSEATQPELFCCMYKNQQGLYSAVSPYLPIQHPTDVAPTLAVPTLPPPILSVEPPSGMVERGDTLYFRCSVPALRSAYKPSAFSLLRAASGGESVISQHHDTRVSNLEYQEGVFSVGPLSQGEGGEYACFYHLTSGEDVVNSTVSNKIQITVKGYLPVPTLVLQHHTQVWHMLCTGSPSYPGAVFTLYLPDSRLPVASHHVPVTSHETTFPVPVQDTLLALYQCQYSVLLGGKWTNSERSRPLAVSKGLPPPSTPDVSAIDWPLILGSFSAVVLFLCSLGLLLVVVHKRVKAAADKKKKRMEAKFWTHVHTKDHVVDLTLRCTSVTSQEWASGDMGADTTSRSPIWNSHSTFTNPIH
ncbi:uncharacterized protein LOC133477142 isoform X2 [Phyllopteryx taeniolatus]|uniref:uncharacterized protein LOC133477142 isoform X2 n=1 Tax=Phyllopteryx taeniolatus TaxID=161469 RepID=UPI002AD24D5C|nr:uncharacterized protein LOC133477142 isoform X2 [Phyllopteryx taeniolatus]